MNRKQNSLMRFTRTERLAQLSEQEIVIEQKKKEIQAKIEARKKNHSEEVLKRLEAYKEIKTNQSENFKNLCKRNEGHEENKSTDYLTPECSKDGLKNAFSNDGSFLDQFKKLSQSGLIFNSDKNNAFCTATKVQESSKDQQNFPKKPMDSNIHIQLPPPGLTQLFPDSNFQNTNLPPEFKKKDNFHQNESQTCSKQDQIPLELNTLTIPSNNNLSHKKLPKTHSDSISMTFKNNTIKKLELISNPLYDDDDDVDDDDDDDDDDDNKDDNDNDNNGGKNKPCLQNLTEKYVKCTKSILNEKATCPSGNHPTQIQNEDFLSISSASFGDKGKEKTTGDDKVNLNHLAKVVATYGDDFEDVLRKQKQNDLEYRFLFNKQSNEYITFRNLVSAFKTQLEKPDYLKKKKTLNSSSEENETDSEKFQVLKQNEEKKDCKQDVSDLDKNLSQLPSTTKIYPKRNKDEKMYDGYQADSEDEIINSQVFEDNSLKRLPSLDNSVNKCSEIQSTSETALKLQSEEKRKRKRKSRWDDAVSIASNIQPPTLVTNLNLQNLGNVPAPKTNLLSQLTRSDPGLIQYAKQTFGSTNLSEEDWRKAEDHYKINLLYQDLVKKRAEISKLEKAGKFKYEYDSDEDVEGGTWEHKLRQQEMMATQLWAEELTRQAAGKHHIGDFLPPEELEKFMERYNAVKEGREPDLSDYKEFKLKEDNVGYKLLQKMGWNEGQGLGQDGSGITNPVNKPSTRHENQGLGIERPDGLEPGDDEYDAYRKRMMLAYRFRPNPLNNPRRPYY